MSPSITVVQLLTVARSWPVAQLTALATLLPHLPGVEPAICGEDLW